MKRLGSLLLGLIIAGGWAQTALAQVSVTAVPFLTIEPSARGNGMGNAFTAVADDAFGSFWNPAGLAFMQKHHLAIERSPWLADVADDMYLAYLGYNQPVSDLGVFSAHFHYLSMGTNYRTGLDPEILGEFSSFDYAISLGYGTKIQDNLGVGLNLKLVHSNLAEGGQGGELETGEDGKGTSFAVDFGLLYKNLGLKGLNAAVVIQNLGPDMTYIDAAQSDPLPRNLRVALAYSAYHSDFMDVMLVGEVNKLLVNFDEELGVQLGEQAIPSGGAEVLFLDMFAARGGYYRDKEGHVTGATFGGGFKMAFGQYQGELNFAYIPGGELQDYNKKFSLAFSF